MKEDNLNLPDWEYIKNHPELYNESMKIPNNEITNEIINKFNNLLPYGDIFINSEPKNYEQTQKNLNENRSQFDNLKFFE